MILLKNGNLDFLKLDKNLFKKRIFYKRISNFFMKNSIILSNFLKK